MRILIVYSVFLALVLAPPARAQTSCDECRVRLVKVAELSSEKAPVPPSLAATVAAANGHFYVTYLFQPPSILKFSSAGELAGYYDRQGEGPGELRSFAQVFVRNDTLLVWDAPRVHYFTPDLEPIETHLTDTRAVRIKSVPTHGLVGKVTSPTGAEVRVLRPGATTWVSLPLDPRLTDGGEPVFGPGDDGAWTAASNESRLAKVDIDGSTIIALTPRRDWFLPWSGEVIGEPFTVRPRNQVSDVGLLGGGRVLLASRVADTNWSAMGKPGTEIMFHPAKLDLSTIYDTVFEVISIQDGEVVARGRHDRAITRVEGTSNLYFSPRSTEVGHVVIDVWRVELSSR